MTIKMSVLSTVGYTVIAPLLQNMAVSKITDMSLFKSVEFMTNPEGTKRFVLNLNIIKLYIKTFMFLTADFEK